MRILLSNDDGYQSEGIQALYHQLSAFADVHMIAPKDNNSAVSSALSLRKPMYVEEAHTGGNQWHVNGTPADCMHIALSTLLDYTPDLVVSGINDGANLGDDTVYSGTVGAATEGYLFGVPSIAFSLVEKGWAHLDAAAAFAAQFVQRIQPETDQPWLLNVNIPNLPANQLKSAVTTRLGRRHHAMPAIKQQAPDGRTMYWIGPAGDMRDNSEGTDFYAVEHGHPSITPLNVDRTEYSSLEHWKTIFPHD